MKEKFYFKELQQVKELTGWGRMYYCFDDLDRYDSALMLNYLIDTEPITKEHCLEKGKEEYIRYSDSYIQERLGLGLTNHLITKMLEDLQNHEYIDVQLAKGKGSNFPVRYIKLNYDKLCQALGLDDVEEIKSQHRYY